MKSALSALIGVLLLWGATKAHAQFGYKTNADGESITITNYAGAGGSVTVPATINGLKVTSIGNASFEFCTNLSSIAISGSVTNIGEDAFLGCTDLTSVSMPNSVVNIGASAYFECFSLTNLVIPASVTNIGSQAFFDCDSLVSVYFGGNAPSVGFELWSGVTDSKATFYYLPGTAGWSASNNILVGLRSMLWNPLIQTGDGRFGLTNNQFGFDITGTTNIPIVVEACTNLASPVWTRLTNAVLTNGLSYFSEPVQVNNSGRFYRISAP